MITETFDRRTVRVSVALLIGIPVTLIALPLSFVSLVTGFAVLDSPEKFMFVAMVVGPILGLLGIAGAWLRIAITEHELRQNPSRRNLILGALAAGIMGSLMLSVFFWGDPNLRPLVVAFVVAAVFGAFLVRVSLPVRPNSTVETDARNGGARGSQ